MSEEYIEYAIKKCQHFADCAGERIEMIDKLILHIEDMLPRYIEAAGRGGFDDAKSQLFGFSAYVVARNALRDFRSLEKASQEHWMQEKFALQNQNKGER